MFITLGTPRTLSGLGVTLPDLAVLKRWHRIAVLDDEPFIRAAALQAHGFQLTELGGDIKSIDQIAAYPIVICDIRGVGRAFGSRYEGAHVISEIRKSYPDKYLIAYTGYTHDVSYSAKLANADASATKDASIEYWTNVLEVGLKTIGDPRARWIRFRSTLLDRGVDLFDVLQLEQAFIKSIRQRDSGLLTQQAQTLHFPADIMDLVIKFSAAALVGLIEHLMTK